jgi:hypothetical protein
MIQTITQLTDCKVAVGQNGRIWIDGPDEGIISVRECLRLIDEEGHRSGLTERIQSYLEATQAPGSTHDFRPREVEEIPHDGALSNSIDLPTPPPLDLEDPTSRAPAEETDTDLPPDY